MIYVYAGIVSFLVSFALSFFFFYICFKDGGQDEF